MRPLHKLTDEERENWARRQRAKIRRNARMAANRSIDLESLKAEKIKSYKSLFKRIQSLLPSKIPNNLPDVDSLEELPYSELLTHHSKLSKVLDSKEWMKAIWKESWRNLHKTNFVWFFLIVFWPLGLYLLAKRILDQS